MMLGYILVEDIFDEMSQNISYIKLNCYLKEGRNNLIIKQDLIGKVF